MGNLLEKSKLAQYKVFMHEFNFVKMNGLGNDFVVIDQRVSEFDLSEEQIKLICNRTDGVGCDQLIMIRKSQDNSDPLIKFFNSDGSEIDACGNGSRCVANFLMKETLLNFQSNEISEINKENNNIVSYSKKIIKPTEEEIQLHKKYLKSYLQHPIYRFY